MIENKHKKHLRNSLENQTGIASNGMQITCIDDNGAKDITVRFEDGAIVYHQRRESFKNGKIRHPSIQTDNVGKKLASHIGEVFYDKNGRRMTIVEYHGNSNVTVEYDDHIRVYDKEYRTIKAGADIYPKTLKGQKSRAVNGLRIECIDDNGYDELTVRFEDGAVVNNVTRQNFRSGNVKHPNKNARTMIQGRTRIGKENMMQNGLRCRIINYAGAKDIDVLFENGTLVQHREWDVFMKGRLGSPKQIGEIRLEHFAYRIDSDWFYEVSSTVWTENKIMSVREIYESQNMEYHDWNRKGE